ncbi:MAG: PAS domain-containing protein [Endomicrobium sp.]|jgi:PAS domain S-box-containing protein|nr:PAS domain-containing protein [Endomicrobium sp.]
MSNNTMVIDATVASFRNLPTTIPIKDSVVIFWESHTKNPEDKGRIQSAIDLIPKKFDMKTCEKYEVRTGYLSRYNYLTKPKENCSIEEFEEGVVKGEEEQAEWIKRCEPNLEGFTQINWQECVSKNKNPNFISCRELLLKTINEDASFRKVYQESADAYAIKRNTNKQNGFSYLVEENAWILTLPYLYPNKQIYVTHVGNVTDSTTILFSTFEYLRESVRLLFPCFSTQKFANIADFKTEYENKHNQGYFVEDKNFMNVVANVKEDCELSKKDLLDLLISERANTEFLTNIIAKMPGHVYWMNSKHVYMGCNDIQAKHLGLNSREEIVGKTVFDFLSEAEAKKHRNINKLVTEKCKLYTGEEKASMNNGFRTYMSHKIPLTNSAGKIIGLLGISIDITDRKKAEELEKKLAIQSELYEIGKEVIHEIWAPLPTLGILHFGCKDKLSKQEREILEWAIQKLREVSDMLLKRYMQAEIDKDGKRYLDFKKYLSVYDSLYDGLDKK